VSALLMAACSGGGAEDGSSSATVGPEPTEPRDEPQADDAGPVGDPAELADLPGRLAVVSDAGLEVMTPTGERTPLLTDCIATPQLVALEVTAQGCATQSVTQPTWAPDGRRLAASVLDGRDVSRSAVVVADVRESAAEVLRSTDRAPFFYSWRDDGARLAALGPGPEGGTSLTLLDRDGTALADIAEDSGVFVAWEPGGADLVVHDGDDLGVIGPAATRPLIEDLGRGFFTPAWIPGARQTLTATVGADAALSLVDVDSGQRRELIAVEGDVRFVVHPDGDRAAVAHESVAGSDTDRTATVELVDLATGARTPVLDQPAAWLEWSPDGDRLLILTISPLEATWHVRQPDGAVERTSTYVPSRTELRNYLPFYDQYTESPRRWSPDGRAFVYAGDVDGQSGVWVQRVDPVAPIVPLGAGRVAWWSPQ
jgi:Tol biopolymer transport system component